MFAKREIGAMFLIALLCCTLSLTSSATVSGTHMLSNAGESRLEGGGNCDGFFNGFIVGMGIASFLGCPWCGAGAIGARAIQLFAC
jgi:hypothetical protein